ncbi:MAG: glutamate synthase-related protein [Anaerolineae bacterium]|jgi:glutamate synthase domain-containing protein 2
MSGRDRIAIAPAPAPFDYPAAFRLMEHDDYVKYGHPVFEGRSARGDSHWTAEIVTQTWYQAETGRIPISGAGYGGPFAGEGFDGIWLDMSEIVRPTRDGIHGRETISTTVTLGRRLGALSFDEAGRLTSTVPPMVELPLPVLLGPLPLPLSGRAAVRGMAEAAKRIGILALLGPEEWDDDLEGCASSVAFRLTPKQLESTASAPLTYMERQGEGGPTQPLYVEIECNDPVVWRTAGERWPEAVICLRVPLREDVGPVVADLAHAGVGVVHLYADDVALAGGVPLTDALRSVHDHLVKQGLRDSLSIIVSGGIAAAEHVAKSLVCGADAVAIDWILLAAWGCSLWADRGPCPVEQGGIEADWAAQRVVNLMAAWRDQLLEVMGAMGLREARRMRGESGRAIFHRAEEECFKGLLGGTGSLSDYARLPEPDQQNEGDMRWTTALLLTSHEQARTGQPPDGSMEYRIGQSGGGFDRLAFAFELDCDGGPVALADPKGFDLSLALNRRGDDRPQVTIPLPWWGSGMSYGSVGMPVMLSRAMAAEAFETFTSTGEGGYPELLEPYADHVITQVATGLFGVREETIMRARVVEFKYAQGAKPGLGGHLLGNKNTDTVARLREAVEGTSLFSPFPFHSVYSVEDHKKHVDWVKTVNPRALVSVKVSTPTDVDMVAVGSYHAGAHIIQLDGAYGGTGAAPEVAKKNIAMPIEYAIPKVHRFLEKEGVRDEMVLVASGGIRTAHDVAKAIALGADGCAIGTAELVALGCTRLGTCEKGKGCPFGIATTDPELSREVKALEGWLRIVNLYRSWLVQLAGILQVLGMASVAELRGRSDLLVHMEA